MRSVLFTRDRVTGFGVLVRTAHCYFWDGRPGKSRTRAVSQTYISTPFIRNGVFPHLNLLQDALQAPQSLPRGGGRFGPHAREWPRKMLELVVQESGDGEQSSGANIQDSTYL